MIAGDSSLEIIGSRYPNGKNSKKPEIDVIELTSGLDESSAIECVANTQEYPSSPKLQRSSPFRAISNRRSVHDDSAELSCAFLNDTSLGTDSGTEKDAGGMNGRAVIGNYPPSLLGASSPVRAQLPTKCKNALEQVLSEDQSSFTDGHEGASSSLQGSPSGLTFGALGAKWSQKQDSQCLERQTFHKRATEERVSELMENHMNTVATGKALFVQSSPSILNEFGATRETQTEHADRHIQSQNGDSIEADAIIESTSPCKSSMGSPRRSGLYISKRRRLDTRDEQPNSDDEDSSHAGFSTFIINSRFYSDVESQREISKIQTTAAGKKMFNAANKLIKDTNTLKNEMILDIDESLYQEFVADGVDLKNEVHPAQIIHLHEVKSLIKLRRRCSSIYDLNHGLFYPRAEKVVSETVSILFYNALEFFHLYCSEKSKLLEFIKESKTSYPIVIITLVGRDDLIKGIQNMENRRFRQQVEEELHGSRKNRNRSKSKKQEMLEELGITIQDVDQYIDDIAVKYGVQFFTIESKQEFIPWLNSLVAVVGKKRYDPVVRHQEWSHITMRSAQDPRDSLGKTLEQLDQMTALKAQRVISVYQNFQHLFKDVEKGYLTSGDDGNPLMSSASEKAMVTLLTSDNPDDLVYMS
ncbi:LAFA_0F16160g1_1 [Lachancea sp. 'fantastica']|nr:LAFA_0F16160g1_1 [Lachancea sp. 'fantastica']